MAILNELNTLQDNLQTAKTTLSTNLKTKGVTTSQPSDTITKMAADVLTISGGGGDKVDISKYGVKFSYSTFTQLPDFVDWTLPMPEDMGHMFDHCYSLGSIPQLDTSSVTDMRYMVTGCETLTSIPKLDTSKVKYMVYMFQNCSRLTSIPALDTSNVTNMECMFQDCFKLTTIPQLNTSSVITMNSMFQNCFSLITIPALDTSSVADMSTIVDGCNRLTTIEELNVSSITNYYNLLFYPWSSPTATLRTMTLKGLGTVEGCGDWPSAKFAPNWGVNTAEAPNAKQSLVDTFITYSFDRTTAGYSPITVTVSQATSDALTDDEKAQITAKGFTLAIG